MFLNLLQSLKMKISLAALLAVAALQLGWAQQYTVSGTISREDGTPVSGVEVFTGVAGLPAVYTDLNGFYQFQLSAGESATLTPYDDNDPLFGVTTFDKVMITRHIDGVELLNSPFKIIAADADHSGVVDYADTSTVADLIFGITPNFPNNTSWRFVAAGYTWPNPANPFATAFPESISINNIAGDVDGLDFVAVKIGDVNLSGGGNPFYASKIQGVVFYDKNLDCIENGNDTRLDNWKVVATGNNGSFYANTNASGVYEIYVNPGTYDVTVVPPNSLWASCAGTVPNVTVASLGTATANFAEQPTALCPAMDVELANLFLRRCFESSYVVNYCNQGTSTAANASVDVTLDPYFTNVSSSIPWASVNGDTYTFNLGNVPGGECGSFTIHFEVSCDAELGQTHCTSAHIYPDQSCEAPNALWSGGDLVVTGQCTGDEVLFTITNLGADMTEPAPYVIIEDVMIQMSGEVLLNQGESMSIPAIAADGGTWRLQAQEVAYHPFETFASATVEGCTDGSPVTFGFVNQFPMPDESPFEDIDCQQNIGSFDPNDKRGLPAGVGEAHFIEQNQDLTYTIRFQNTGTDTAFNIFIIDTLSASLDPATMRVLGSSHPCDLLLEGNGVAKFIFSNIMLPDSNVNETLSHGFVKFNIKQRPDVALGTQIENEAGIYFDFNEPVITNRTLHTVGKDFLLEVSATQTLIKGMEMEVFPNPTAAVANFRFKGHEINNGLLTVFDQQGRPVCAVRFQGTYCQLDGKQLPSGTYFFKVEDAGRGVASGTLMVR